MGQKQYVDSIRKKMIVFGIGPAGTGKTVSCRWRWRYRHLRAGK
ncbi:MAG: PhoH family protein [Clostridium fessum]